MAEPATFYCRNRSCRNRWADFRSPSGLCPTCGAMGEPLVRYTDGPPRITITPDVPEHFNITTGCAIRSRRHLRELQKARGWQDYERDSSAAARRKPKPLNDSEKQAIHEMVRAGGARFGREAS